MGGEVQWAAVPMLAAMHGVDDLEALSWWLVEFRNGMRTNQVKANG
jgi:hypothetical protein